MRVPTTSSEMRVLLKKISKGSWVPLNGVSSISLEMRVPQIGITPKSVPPKRVEFL